MLSVFLIFYVISFANSASLYRVRRDLSHPQHDQILDDAGGAATVPDYLNRISELFASLRKHEHTTFKPKPPSALSPDEARVYNRTDLLELVEDMRLTKQQACAIYDYTLKELGGSASRRKREVESDLSVKWKMPIQFKFDRTHSSAEQSMIREAVAEWMHETCIQFTEVDPLERPAENHLIFTKAAGCWSYIGSVMHEQFVSLGDGCFSMGTRLHEIGHALGFYHEHNRNDRDNHLTVHWNNIRSGVEYAFFKVDPTESVYSDYDYHSVMHYSQLAFTANGGKTSTPKDPLFINTPGQRDALTFSDIHAINQHYCADTCHGVILSQKCENGGYQDVHDCAKCKCPDGFDGNFCQTVASGYPSPACGGLTRHSSGERVRISAAFAGRQMEGGQQCTWLFEAPQGETVTVNFADFGTYKCGYAWRCEDYIEVRSNGSMHQSGPKLCACLETETKQLTSTGNKMMLLLRSPSKQRRVAPTFDITISGATTTTAGPSSSTSPTTPPTISTPSPTTTSTTTARSSSTSTTVSSTVSSSSSAPTKACYYGNTIHYPEPGTGCLKYRQGNFLRSCFFGLKFNVEICACDWPSAFVCEV